MVGRVSTLTASAFEIPRSFFTLSEWIPGEAFAARTTSNCTELSAAPSRVFCVRIGVDETRTGDGNNSDPETVIVTLPPTCSAGTLRLLIVGAAKVTVAVARNAMMRFEHLNAVRIIKITCQIEMVYQKPGTGR